MLGFKNTAMTSPSPTLSANLQLVNLNSERPNEFYGLGQWIGTYLGTTNAEGEPTGTYPLDTFVNYLSEKYQHFTHSVCGYTPLMVAYTRQDTQCFEHLLSCENTSTMLETDRFGNSIFDHAIDKDDVKTFSKLLQHGHNLDDNTFQKLISHSILKRAKNVFSLIIKHPKFSDQLLNGTLEHSLNISAHQHFIEELLRLHNKEAIDYISHNENHLKRFLRKISLNKGTSSNDKVLLQENDIDKIISKYNGPLKHILEDSHLKSTLDNNFFTIMREKSLEKCINDLESKYPAPNNSFSHLFSKAKRHDILTHTIDNLELIGNLSSNTFIYKIDGKQFSIGELTPLKIDKLGALFGVDTNLLKASLKEIIVSGGLFDTLFQDNTATQFRFVLNAESETLHIAQQYFGTDTPLIAQSPASQDYCDFNGTTESPLAHIEDFRLMALIKTLMGDAGSSDLILKGNKLKKIDFKHTFSAEIKSVEEFFNLLERNMSWHFGETRGTICHGHTQLLSDINHLEEQDWQSIFEQIATRTNTVVQILLEYLKSKTANTPNSFTTELIDFLNQDGLVNLQKSIVEQLKNNLLYLRQLKHHLVADRLIHMSDSKSAQAYILNHPEAFTGDAVLPIRADSTLPKHIALLNMFVPKPMPIDKLTETYETAKNTEIKKSPIRTKI